MCLRVSVYAVPVVECIRTAVRGTVLVLECVFIQACLTVCSVCLYGHVFRSICTVCWCHLRYQLSEGRTIGCTKCTPGHKPKYVFSNLL